MDLSSRDVIVFVVLTGSSEVAESQPEVLISTIWKGKLWIAKKLLSAQ